MARNVGTTDDYDIQIRAEIYAYQYRSNRKYELTPFSVLRVAAARRPYDVPLRHKLRPVHQMIWR